MGLTLRSLIRGHVLTSLMGFLVISGQVIAAQETTPVAVSPVVAGGDEIAWTGDWQYTVGTSTSLPDQATFTHVDIETQILKRFAYVVVPGDSLEDSAEAIVMYGDFLEEGGALNVNEVATGTLEDDTLWTVYTFNASESDGFSEGGLAAIVTVAENDEGDFVVTAVTANIPLLGDTITQVQDEFTLNGDEQFLVGIDSAEVTADLPEESILVTGATPEASPAGTPGSSPASTPDD